MRKNFLSTFLALIFAGSTQAAITFTIHVTSATTFEVWMKPDADITTGGAGISSMGMTFETPSTLNPSGINPSPGAWAVTSNSAFFPGSPGLLSTQFKQSAAGNWESNFNWSNGTGAGNQSFAAGTEYLLATFTLPAGLQMTDIAVKDWQNNKIDNTGAPTWGFSIAMGPSPDGIEQPASVLYATTGSTGPASNSGTASGTSTMFLAPANLPLQFLSFDAEKSGLAALLRWKTAQEVNVKEFLVQHSSSGTDWINLGTVAALGNTGQANSYSYTDAAPVKGNNYYRIAEQDLDGKLLYTGIRTLQFGGDGDFTATLYPVPATTTLTVATHSPAAEKALLRITDIQGRVVRTQEVQLVKGETTLPAIDLRGYAAGTYTIEIKGASVSWTGKFITQK